MPEYNHIFPAPLKDAIGWQFVEWQAQPAGFASYGGAGGGLWAGEQLRQVFAGLCAVTVRTTVSFHTIQTLFDAESGLEPSQSRERAAKAMLDRIAWCGSAHREARAKGAYPR